MNKTSQKLLLGGFGGNWIPIWWLVQKKLQSGLSSPTVGYKCVKRVFSDEEEHILRDYIIASSDLHYELALREIRKLAFQLAIEYEKDFPPTWN